MNPWFVALAGLLAWLSAQCVKVIIVSIRKRMFTSNVFFAPGRMPSGHAAGTVGLASAVYFQEGVTTTFVVAGALAIITMYDAITSRTEIGKHAQFLNALYKKKITFEEIVGHTPLQVLVGACLGFIVAYVVML